METAHGFAAPAVSALARGIREYSLFQAVLLVMDRLRQEHPGLGDEALYDQLEFRPILASASRAAMSIGWSSSKSAACCGRGCVST